MKKRGFTIVELIVVIVVIAILAAISIVAYIGIQQRANASAASSALSQAKKKLEMYKIDNGTYPTTSNLAAAGVTDSAVSYQYTSDGSSYCMTGTAGTVSYKATDLTVPASGGCAGHGQGGASAITNLATDPRATVSVWVSGQVGWKGGRWAGSAPAAATYTIITGAADGPVGITTYIRKTWTVAPAAIGNTGDTGFDNAVTPMVISEGQVYTVSCYVRPSVIRNFNIGIYQYTSAGAGFTPARSYAPSITGAAGQWTRVSYTYTVPTGVGQIRPVCDSNGETTNSAANWQVGSTLDGTGLMIMSGSTLYSYADGNSPNWAWSGTPNASASAGPAL